METNVTFNSNSTNNSQNCLVSVIFVNQLPQSATRLLPQSAIPTWIAVSIINGITALPTFLVNLLVLLAVLDNHTLRSSNYNILVGALSLADLLVGLVAKPIFVALNVCNIVRCSHLCELATAYSLTVVLCNGWSFATITIVCLERYLFIEHPLHYHAKVTTSKVIVTTAVGWLLVTAIILLARLQFENSYVIRTLLLFFTFFPCVFVILFCSIKVHVAAFRQIRRIAALTAFIQQSNQNILKEYKRIFTLGIVLIVLTLSFCPMMIIRSIGLQNKQKWSATVRFTVTPICTALFHLNSLFNPFIFSLRLSDIRRAASKKIPSFIVQTFYPGEQN